MRLRIPLLDWVSGYRREWLEADLVAGLTTAAVVILRYLRIRRCASPT
jgi:SulP family sulfate permease